MKYNIIPINITTETLEAKNKEDAIINFATSMDSDMNGYFKAVPDDELPQLYVSSIVDMIRTSKFEPCQISEIFRALKEQSECLGGKIWTTADIEDKLDDMTDGDVTVTDEIVDRIYNELNTDVFDDCTDLEWSAIEDAVRDADIRIRITDIEWDVDEEDYDEDLDLPEELEVRPNELEGRSVADFLSDQYEFCVRSCAAAYVSAKEV